MIAVAWESATAYLLNDEPDWWQRVSLKAGVPTRQQRSLTGREARRPIADTLRCELGWTALLDADVQADLRNALQDLATEPILCPAWPFATTGLQWASASVSGGQLIGWLNDWSDYEIGETLTDPTEWDFVAPLLVGRLRNTPQPANYSPAYANVDFEFIEDGDAAYALAPDAVSWTNGPALGDATTPPLFPFALTWNAAVESGAAEIEVERQQLAKGRASAHTGWPQSAERPLSADLLLTTGSDIAALLRWLVDRHGSAGTQYCTEGASVATLAASAAAGTNSLTFTDADPLGDNRYVELSDGLTRETVRISSLAGDVATLTANLAHTWSTTTLVRLALLARLAKDELQLEFASPEVATTRLAWREVPAEYTIAAGETRGTTLGALPTRAWLYLVTLDWNGTTEEHRFTSFERDLSASSQTWTARPCEHSELRQNLALDRDEITLKVRWWEGCPFRIFLPGYLDCKITLAIYECAVSGSTGSSVTQWFGGEITGCNADGPFLSLSAAGANALFDRRIPRILMQTTCNHALYDSGCGLDRDDWEFTADVYSVSGTTLVLENFSRTGGLPSGFGFEHWFALGFVEATISGLPARRFIHDSAALDGDSRISLTLASAFISAPAVGASVKLWPGCDGWVRTCKAWHTTANATGKYDNFLSYGGFPYIPTTNPAFQPLKQSDSNTGKK